MSLLSALIPSSSWCWASFLGGPEGPSFDFGLSSDWTRAAHWTFFNPCLPWHNLQWRGWSIYLWCCIAAWDLRRKWNLPWICTKVWSLQVVTTRVYFWTRPCYRILYPFLSDICYNLRDHLVGKLGANINQHSGIHVHVERGKPR